MPCSSARLHCFSLLGVLALGLMLAPALEALPLAQETPAENESVLFQTLIQLTREGSEKKYPNGPMLRFNQPRHAGCVKAEFTVENNLPEDLRIGLFKEPKTYSGWLRFASAASASDTEKDFRGFSLKLFDIPGKKLMGKTQDFVLNSHPVLFVANPADFADFIDYSIHSNPVLFFFNPLNLHWKEFKIVMAGRQNHPNHLDIRYWSTTPYLFGEGQAVKYSVKPCQPVQADPPDSLTENYLREALKQRLSQNEACFDFLIQFQKDAELMPIEDATVEWDEALSPFLKVATIHIPSQTFDSPQQMAFCEDLAFNPWYSLVEHRPLGGINRARKSLYQAAADFRHQKNQRTYHEPTGKETF